MSYSNDTNTTSSSEDLSLKDWNPNPLPEQSIQTATKWMWLLWPPVILAMGTFGNVASLAVLSRVGVVGTSPINIYLFALALSDLVVLYTGLLRYWVLQGLSYDVYSWHAGACKMGMWLYATALNNSTYLLVVLTIQRAFSVVYPHRVHLTCKHCTTLTLIGGIAVASLILMAHVPYGYDVVTSGNGTQYTCGIGSSEYFRFIVVLVYFQIVTLALLPFVCLLISNLVLAWRLKISVSAAKQLTTDHSTKMKERRKKASSTTITVMAMSLTFIIFTLPLFINLIINSTDNLDAHQKAGTSPEGHFVQSFVNILLYCNSAVNFYLYCLTGTKFRREFLSLFHRTTKTQDAVTVQSRTTEDKVDEF